MIEIISGNLLDAKEKYIAHQCNAITNHAKGLAHSIFTKFPYADIYTARPYPYKPTGDDLPGNIIVRGDGKDNRFVINMIGQWYPSKSKDPNSKLDGTKVRIEYFRQCLFAISQINSLDSIAFPYFIGCGLAGGDWNIYLDILNGFSKHINNTQSAVVRLYKHNA